MVAAAGTLLNVSKRAQNQGKVGIRYIMCVCIVTTMCVKPVRYNLDAWDDMMMERDKRLTGHVRGQRVRRICN